MLKDYFGFRLILYENPKETEVHAKSLISKPKM
jgi:hypothetical protein